MSVRNWDMALFEPVAKKCDGKDVSKQDFHAVKTLHKRSFSVMEQI